MGSIVVNEDSMEIAVVGGNIVGLILTAGLAHRNIRVKFYDQARGFREIGAGIAFTANAIRCMDIINPAIVTALRSGGSVPTSADKNDPNDYLRWTDGFNERAEGQSLLYKIDGGYKGFEGCRRDQFLEALVKIIPEGILELRKRLEDVQRSEKLTLNFNDDSRAEVDAIIACDGIESKVRELMFGNQNPATVLCYTHKSAQRPVAGFEAQFQVMRNLINVATDAAANQEVTVGFEFVSSIAVVGHYPLWTGNRVVPEEHMCIRSVLPNGYGDAKYVCEMMLDVTLGRHPEQSKALVVRPGQIAGSKNSGTWNATEHLSFLIKSCQTLKALPVFNGELCWTPVGDVAGTCADLLLAESTSQFIYHIDNPVRQPWAPMLELWAEILGIPLSQIIPFEEWIERVRIYGGKASDNPAIRLLGFLDENFMRMSCGGLLLGTEKSVRDSKTMTAVGPVEDQVTRKYFKAWREIGYLKVKTCERERAEKWSLVMTFAGAVPAI